MNKSMRQFFMTVVGIVVAVIVLMYVMRINNAPSHAEGFSSGSGFGIFLLVLLVIGGALFLFKGNKGSSASVHPSIPESQNRNVNAAAERVEHAAERLANANTPSELRSAAAGVTKAAAAAKTAATKAAKLSGHKNGGLPLNL
jgi:Na+/melibiose symporter-like transporter